MIKETCGVCVPLTSAFEWGKGPFSWRFQLTSLFRENWPFLSKILVFYGEKRLENRKKIWKSQLWFRLVLQSFSLNFSCRQKVLDTSPSWKISGICSKWHIFMSHKIICDTDDTNHVTIGSSLVTCTCICTGIIDWSCLKVHQMIVTCNITWHRSHVRRPTGPVQQKLNCHWFEL